MRLEVRNTSGARLHQGGGHQGEDVREQARIVTSQVPKRPWPTSLGGLQVDRRTVQSAQVEVGLAMLHQAVIT